MNNDKNELFLDYRETGDIALRNELIISYMGMVEKTAMVLRNIYAKGYDVGDLINEGMLALISAVEIFDVTKGVKFETFASFKIKGAIVDYIRRQDFVPRRVRLFGRELNEAYNHLYNSLKRTPLNNELAEYMNMTEEQFSKRLADTAVVNTLSFEELLYEDNFALYGGETMSGGRVDAPLYARERSEIIAKAIEKLKPKEQKVVSLYYYEKLKFKEIAEVLGITESRVCQIHSRCMLLLRKTLEDYVMD